MSVKRYMLQGSDNRRARNARPRGVLSAPFDRRRARGLSRKRKRPTCCADALRDYIIILHGRESNVNVNVRVRIIIISLVYMHSVCMCVRSAVRYAAILHSRTARRCVASRKIALVLSNTRARERAREARDKSRRCAIPGEDISRGISDKSRLKQD